MASVPRRDLRRRLRRITRVLEGRYGTPEAAYGGDLVGQLVQTILSQNTTDGNSDAAFERLRDRFGTWSAVARAHPRSVESAIRSAGLARTKAATIKRALARLERERGRIELGFLSSMPTPQAMAYLTAVGGVGLKTAACVMLFGLGRGVVPVDTHVHRVIGRLGVVGHPRTREKTFEALSGAVPDGKALSLHVNLVRHGRAVCTARRPRCERCVLAGECAAAPAESRAREEMR